MSQLAHKFDPSILREYDIRGIVGGTVHAADAQAIGRTLGTLVRRKGGKRVALGYDGRLSSPELAAACIEGLTAAGIDVIDIGLAATPMLYFAVYHLEADGGIQITGSHNPPDYNGFKMMMGKKSFFGADIQKLGEMAGKGDWETGQGKVEKRAILADYAARLLRDVKPGKKLKVAWDTGNGAVGVSIRSVVDKLEGEHFVLNEKVDGTFPAHHPDPTVPKNLEQLIAEVKARGCDLGIAFDGDGDRIGAVDGQGRILWGDQLLVLWSRDVLKTHPGATIIADVKASQVLFDEIAKAGGTPLMFKTGHSLIKSKMAEIGSPLAGEMSGHVFFADTFYGFDDALYCGLRLLNIVANAEESLADMRDGLPQPVNTPELRFDCPDDQKFGVVEKVKARLQKEGAKFSDIDGVRVSTKDGWWLLRASNTQPVLVARCEAADDAGLERLMADLKAALAACGVDLPDDAGSGHH
ncbi:phosphoglucomutase/phosphomannomutase PgmG [Reyranella sp.]|jgi:phosphomannomutase|uniref:phosphoglucomutase/phosphomannomutase PgmG n=1 Tax=Reyranella sp. TaxID=1929291 RepID=UPI000BD4AD7A|nr:phosphomannomutase/phosphoglucomutase [Reyranella sp.]OYY42009.1 MAG: phosphomannomutase [Rhodospirillales bacterium 35-66-84]OYZ93790.1 MAG: phosphomannomutase [Rhodospirillales bacterium 24-66-33]OZB25040.1 MAG: phosphomannomutase [Rhodospirillales bacterium 39-66-50]HQS17888.1 phosphomannomutase/phosphoglucomutase [Reyranella sp.]HQT10675.1 phosphomannomutase/phosphoglucomutase [Reyranella sp.]